MDIKNLMSQLGSATNPMAMMMGMLSPNQRQIASQFRNKTSQEQAEMIANKCNELGISKEQLEEMMKMFKK